MDIKAIIAEVARRHKIRLAEDDPILATVTVIEVVHRLFVDELERMVEAVANQATDRLAAEIETGRRVIADESLAAKAAAAKLVNDAGAWSGERFKQLAEEAVVGIRASLKQDIDALQEGISQGKAHASAAAKHKRTAMFAACGAIGVCLVILAASIGFWLGSH